MILVLINHGFKHTGFVEGVGRTGVNLFFVISGLLTALSLLSIERRGGNIWLELPRKRLWRLVPTAWVFIALCVVISPFVWGDAFNFNLSVIFFYANYTREIFPLGHLWSISCEMHFYLASPLLFWLALRSGPVGKIGLFAVSGMLLATGAWYAMVSAKVADPIMFGSAFFYKYATQVAVWPMVFGFIWGLYRPFRNFGWKRFRKALPLIVFAGHVALAVALLWRSSMLTVLMGVALMPLVILSYEASWSLPGAFGRMLVWVGKRTYSIYLVQQMFTLAAPFPQQYYPLGALVAIPVGAVFYALVESRFVKK